MHRLSDDEGLYRMFYRIMETRFPDFMPKILIIDALGIQFRTVTLLDGSDLLTSDILTDVVDIMHGGPWDSLKNFHDPEPYIFFHSNTYESYPNYLEKIDYNEKYDCLVIVSLDEEIKEQKLLSMLTNRSIVIDMRDSTELSDFLQNTLKNNYYKMANLYRINLRK